MFRKSLVLRSFHLALISCLVLSLFSPGIFVNRVEAAAEKVKLLYSVIQQQPNNSYTWTGAVEVDNLAYDKKVSVVYSIANQEWRELEAQYSGTTDNNLEAWTFSLDHSELYNQHIQFAVKYEVNGQTYWDNNGGHGQDYHIGIGHEAGAPSVILHKSRLIMGDYSLANGQLSAQVYLLNIAYHKEVKMVYTTDGWNTQNEAFAQYSGGLHNSNSIETWSFQVPVANDAPTVEFAVAYIVDGVTYWDNNLQHNYIVNATQELSEEEIIRDYLDRAAEDDDGDGLTNGFEIEYLMGISDPAVFDTDQDGVSDADEDSDFDGLSNLVEQSLGTDPLLEDSDGDGLSDGFEVNVTLTSPILPDTDGDGLSDYDEWILGLDPLNSDSNNDGIIDSEEQIEQSVQHSDDEDAAIDYVEVALESKGNLQKKIQIRSKQESDKLTSEVVGIVGHPYDIHPVEDVEFDEAKITFKYDRSNLGDTLEENLIVLWYNEDNDEFIEMPSVLNTANGTVTATTTHFSQYMLVDKEEWFAAWRSPLNYRPGNQKGLDIVFAIDSSGSMLTNDPSGLRKTAAKSFVDKFFPEDKGAVVDWDSSAYVIRTLTDDKDAIKTAIDTIDSSGGTTISRALVASINELLSPRATPDSSKIIILLTDGEDSSSLTSSINQAIANDIKIYTIGLGSTVNHAKLQNMSSQTGGSYYRALTSAELEEVFEAMKGNTLTEVDPTDTDGDGLYDIYEIVGMRLSNGTIVYSDPFKIDTDGDGLTDYQEISIRSPLLFPINNPYQQNNSIFMMRSYPNRVDSDFDGYNDRIDPRPLKYHVNDVMAYNLGLLENLAEEYNDGRSYDRSKYKTSKEKWLVYMFIRQFNSGYTGGTWASVGGEIDDGFVSFVQSNNREVYDYFASTTLFNSGGYSSEKVDLYHWAATATVYIYNSTHSDGFKSGMMPEHHLNNLGGWAGDLQTLMVHIAEEGVSDDYNTFYSEMYNGIGHPDKSFSMDDLLADTDAYNLYLLMDQTPLEDTFMDYYSSGYKQRYTMFTNDKDKEWIRGTTHTYTKEKYMHFVKWPLFGDVSIKGNLTDAARDAFTDYIWTKVQAEK